jgi:hypothetical protein
MTRDLGLPQHASGEEALQSLLVLHLHQGHDIAVDGIHLQFQGLGLPPVATLATG